MDTIKMSEKKDKFETYLIEKIKSYEENLRICETACPNPSLTILQKTIISELQLVYTDYCKCKENIEKFQGK